MWQVVSQNGWFPPRPLWKFGAHGIFDGRERCLVGMRLLRDMTAVNPIKIRNTALFTIVALHGVCP